MMSDAAIATGPAGGSRTITAFFERRGDADDAVERLSAAGFPRASIRVIAGAGGSVSRDAYPAEGTGFWEALKDLFLPDSDRHVYAEGLQRGGFLLTLASSEADCSRAMDILDAEGAVDLEQRETDWRAQGWTGYTGADCPASTEVGREEVIPVVEEQLRVGKRDVTDGRVRVRSYVVETPVAEQVNLREEQVSVDRRAVDRPVADQDNPFQERTIEVEQKAEEAVASKEARVKEELVVNKQVGERTETVSDKVRHTEVNIDDDRSRRSAGSAGRGR